MTSFEKDGINPEDPINKRLWRVSRVLDKSPFEDAVLSLTPAQMNFIIKMHIADNPDLYKPDTSAKAAAGILPIQLQKAWNIVLSGKIGLEFIKNPIQFFKKKFNINIMDEFKE